MRHLIISLIIILTSNLCFSQYDPFGEYLPTRQLIVATHIKKLTFDKTSVFYDRDSTKEYFAGRKIYYFDTLGNVTKTVDYCGSFGKCDSTTFQEIYINRYNDQNDPIKTTRYQKGDSLKVEYEISYAYIYDSLNRKTSENFIWMYDFSNEPDYRNATYQYSKSGDLYLKRTTELNGNIFKEQYIYSKSRQLISKTSFSKTSKVSATEYTYDSKNNLVNEKYFYYGQLACGNVPSEKSYEYYDCGKIKREILVDFQFTYIDSFKYKDCGNIIEKSRSLKNNTYKIDTVEKQVSQTNYFYNDKNILTKIVLNNIGNKSLLTIKCKYESY
jgi:hypothetical protein